MVSAIAALSNQGLCPKLKIASAVETPAQGWVVLPEPEKPIQCISSVAAEQVTESLRDYGKQFWEYKSSNTDKAQPITWYLAGTLANWSGTPLSVVVVLEETAPSLAQSIGRAVLQQTIQP
jgi:hypothetical protein